MIHLEIWIPLNFCVRCKMHTERKAPVLTFDPQLYSMLANSPGPNCVSRNLKLPSRLPVEAPGSAPRCAETVPDGRSCRIISSAEVTWSRGLSSSHPLGQTGKRKKNEQRSFTASGVYRQIRQNLTSFVFAAVSAASAGRLGSTFTRLCLILARR